jgi:Zn-finger nucleic acid-binding protein
MRKSAGSHNRLPVRGRNNPPDETGDVSQQETRAMKCPVCVETGLVMSERSGIEIDFCPKCRGVWLDRGELDKIIERSDRGDDDDDDRDDKRRQQLAPPQEAPQGYSPPPPGYPPYGYPPPHKYYKKKSFWHELFD